MLKLPSVDAARAIAAVIFESMTENEQCFAIAGFTTAIQYLEKLNQTKGEQKNMSEEIMLPVVFRVKMAEGCEEYFPKKAHASDAGFDLCSTEKHTVLPGETKLIKTGVFIALEEGWEAQIRPRSGLAFKYGISITNSPGTIDAGYRNEIGVLIHNTKTPKHYLKYGANHTEDLETGAFVINKGDRIAQMVIKRVPKVHLIMVEELDETDRGLNGFGSSGTQVSGLPQHNCEKSGDVTKNLNGDVLILKEDITIERFIPGTATFKNVMC